MTVIQITTIVMMILKMKKKVEKTLEKVEKTLEKVEKTLEKGIKVLNKKENMQKHRNVKNNFFFQYVGGFTVLI